MSPSKKQNEPSLHYSTTSSFQKCMLKFNEWSYLHYITTGTFFTHLLIFFLTVLSLIRVTLQHYRAWSHDTSSQVTLVYFFKNSKQYWLLKGFLKISKDLDQQPIEIKQNQPPTNQDQPLE